MATLHNAVVLIGALQASEPKKTAEKRSHSVNVILDRIKRNRESQSRHTEFQKEVELGWLSTSCNMDVCCC